MSNQVSSAALRQTKKDAMEVKVAILGLNRMSGSFGMALREYSNRPNTPLVFNIIGRDDDNDTMRQAQQVGAVDNFHKSLKNVLDGASIVIISSPMGQHEELFEQLGKELAAGTVVIDFSPLKQPGVKLAKRFFPKDMQDKLTAYLVGATPVFGFDGLYTAGDSVEFSKDYLFRGSDFMIAPDATVPPDAVKVVTDLADFLGMIPRFMDPAEHDGLLSLTENLPTVTALALFQMLRTSPGKIDLLRATGSTFANAVHNLRRQDAADVAASTLSNRANLSRHIEQMIGALTSIQEMLNDSDPQIFETFAGQVLETFVEWEVRHEKNKWDDLKASDVQSVQAAGLGLGQVFSMRRSKNSDDD